MSSEIPSTAWTIPRFGRSKWTLNSRMESKGSLILLSARVSSNRQFEIGNPQLASPHPTQRPMVLPNLMIRRKGLATLVDYFRAPVCKRAAILRQVRQVRRHSGNVKQLPIAAGWVRNRVEQGACVWVL